MKSDGQEPELQPGSRPDGCATERKQEKVEIGLAVRWYTQDTLRDALRRLSAPPLDAQTTPHFSLVSVVSDRVPVVWFS